MPPQIPASFAEDIEAAKWSTRKEAIEAVIKLAEAPKLVPGEYGDLVRMLKKVIASDSNVVNVALAAKCIQCLATGLRKAFTAQGATVWQNGNDALVDVHHSALARCLANSRRRRPAL